MATFTRTTKGAGNWDNGANWGATSAPGANPLQPDVDVAVINNIGGTTPYTVNVLAGTSFDLSQLNIDGGPSGTGIPALSVNGILKTDTLDYTAAAGKTNITVNGGGLFDIRSGILDPNNIAETITVSGKGVVGGHLVLGGTNPNVTETFSNNLSGPNTGVIEFLSVASGTTQHVTGMARGDQLVIDGANFAKGDTVTFSGTTLTVKDSSNNTVFTMGGVASNATTFQVAGATIAAVCYARGTMIRTPDGEILVERLRAGRQVMTVVDGEQTARQVKWLGHRRIDLTGHPQPETVAPIRILRGAFADNIPHRDLVVSPDHAIFVDGKLICARQLVNGSTIRQETGWTAVDYYHVELDQHAILLAEGLPAESYIDTGNSGFFYNSDAPLVLRPDLTDNSDRPSREAGSCAPFVSDEATVRPVWQLLADRAAQLGRPVPVRETTTDGGLQLAAKGRRIKAIFASADLVIFALPRGANEVGLMSRAASPTDARPWLDDRRRLGVRVARIVLRGADDVREISVDHPDLGRGWWAIERDGQAMGRWTDGEAVLSLPAMRGDTMLEIHLAGTMTYVVESAATDAAGRRAA